MSEAEQHPVTIEDLHAFADGQLSAERTALVEAHLRDNPDAAARVRDYRALNAALRQAADEAENEESWRDSAAPKTPPRRSPIWQVAAAVAFLLLGLGGGWSGHAWLTGQAQPDLGDLARRAGAAYRVYAADFQHPVDETEADRVAAWLSSRMNMPIRVPDLAQAGFTLVGGRLMIGETDPAGLLMYQDQQGRRLVLYWRNDLPSAEPSRMRFQREAMDGVVTWRDAAAGFGLAGGFSEQELRPLADRIRAQFAS